MPNRIKELRKNARVTVKELSEVIGVSQSMLTNYENNAAYPRLHQTWEDLAKYFDVNIAYLMGLTEDVDKYSSDEFSLNNFIPTFSYKPATDEELNAFLYLNQFDEEDTKTVYDLINQIYKTSKYDDKRSIIIKSR